MRVKTMLRRVAAVLGGLLFPVAAYVWSDWGAQYAEKLFHHVRGVASVFGPNAIYLKFGDLYTYLGLYGLYLAAGLSFALILWDRRPTQKRIDAIFWIFFALALPLAVLNYTQGDIFVSRAKQELVDVVLVFLGFVTLFSLTSMKPQSEMARILQIMAVFFVGFQAVFVPAIFAVLWLLNWERAISLEQTRDFTPGWVSAAAATGSLIVSALQFRRSKPAEASAPFVAL
jgi:hypothetical protein